MHVPQRILSTIVNHFGKQGSTRNDNPMTPESNEEAFGDRPLFEILTFDIPGDVVAQANRLMEERGGRTPYGQLGKAGILRSTSNE